ncbi:MAG: arsenate reductase [Acidimicrobiia bacterium]|nr:arsenate reductase [Acidimicrobiia bacterium]
MPAKPTIYHNPKCSTSCHAVATAQDLGVEVEIVDYLKNPPDRERLQFFVDHLEGPVADLVRKDSHFKELGLDPDDYTEPAAVIDLLEREPRLLQRPLLVRGQRVVIGRPKERIAELLQA